MTAQKIAAQLDIAVRRRVTSSRSPAWPCFVRSGRMTRRAAQG